MKYTRKQTLQFVQAIEDTGYRLNEWETDFIESIRDRWSLTEKQSETLVRIYEKATGHRSRVYRQRF